MLLCFIILYCIIQSINAQLAYASVHYIYVQSYKTWDDAVEYCSDNYDDLATITDITNNNEISSLLAAYGIYGAHAWIGLHYYNSAWRWVDNTVSNYRRWDSQSNQPQMLQCAKYAHSQNVDNTYWLTDNCLSTQHFICNYQNPNTNQPTLTPTSATIDPTTQPTLTPTINPTEIPTTIPTINPTNHPTIIPTEIPTEIPTNNPTLTDNQTSTKPSQRPTTIPTKYDDIEINDETTRQYLEYEVTIKLENAEQLSAEQLNEIVGDILTLDNVQNVEILQVDGDKIILEVIANDELDSDMIKNELIDDYPEIEVEIDDLNDKKIKQKDDSIVVVIMIVCIVLIICVVLIVVLMKTKIFVERNKSQTKLVQIGTKSTDKLYDEHNHNGELERIQTLSIEMVTKGNDEDDIVNEINNSYEDIQVTQGQRDDDIIEGKTVNEYDMNTNIENDEFVIDDEQVNKITRKYATNNGLSEDKEIDNGLNEFVIDGEDENQVTNNGLNQDEFVVNENDHKTKKIFKIMS